MRSLPALALLFLVASCPAPKSDGTAPPRGATYDEYLADGKAKPERPADTNDDNAMVVHLVDIGQGLAILVEFPCGAMLVDTGGEKNDQWDGVDALQRYLDAFFARRTDLDRTLELLVITHPHLDHTRGIAMVLENYQVNNVVDNGMRNEWTEFDGERVEDQGGLQQIALMDWVAARADQVGHRSIKVSEIPITGLTDGVIDPIHGCGRSTTDPQIKVLWGQLFEDRATFGNNPNDHSVALRVDFGKSSVFLPGDLEFIGNSRLDKKYADNREIFDVDIYVVGHHGSKNATTKYMMENMSPKVAGISASPYGRREDWTGRRFGHPNQKAMAHLLSGDYGVSWPRDQPVKAMVGIRGAWKDELEEIFEARTIAKGVYCTCWDGTVRFRGNANGWIDVQTDGR